MNFFWLVLQPFIYSWVFFVFFILIVPISFIALPFKFQTRLKLTAPFWNLFFRISVTTGIMSKTFVSDLRDETSRKTLHPKGLYIANHQSFFDIPVVFSHLIIPPIMKKSLLYIPIFGVCAFSSGAILVDRKNSSSRKKVFKIARERLTHYFKQLQYYPEGTRSKTGKPKNYSEIKSALIKFAFDNNINVYPMSIYGTDQVIQNRLITLGKKLGIILHEPLMPKDFNNSDEFAQACWNKVVNGHQELEEKLATI